MANNWRSNVVDYGMGQMGISLAARLFVGVDIFLTNSTQWVGARYALVLSVPAIGADYYGSNGLPIPDEHPNFPYGYDVH